MEKIKWNVKELKGLHKKLYFIKEMLEYKNGKDEYAFAPCFVGKDYEKCERRLMLVGQNSNGWDYDDGKFSNADEYAEYIIGTYFCYKSGLYSGFQWIEENMAKKKPYWINEKSNFWKFGRCVFERFSGTATVDCKPPKVWQHSIVQSDTMKITKHRGGEGNVTDVSKNKIKCEITAQVDLSYQILLKEISILKPTHIIFMTNDNEYFFETLKEVFELVPDDIGLLTNKIVKRTGEINGSKCFVTIHPEGFKGARIHPKPGETQLDCYLNALDVVNKYKNWDLF